MAWPRVRLGDIAQEFISGGTPSTKVEHYWTGDIPWITGADVTDNIVVAGRKWITREAIDNSATHVVPKGAILLVTRTGVGKVAIAGADIAISQDLTGIVLKEGTNADFVVAAIRQKTRNLLDIQQGAIIKGVLRKDVEKLEIPLPPLSEQRRIVEILDQAERIRRLRADADAKAERILPALFIKMFGDPATNPMGWPKCSISELATVITGNTPSRKRQDYFGDYIEWVKSDNLNTPSHYITPTAEYLSEEGAKVGRKALPGSALVTCIAGSPSAIGNVALADREVAFNQQINAAVPREGVDCYYLYGHFVVGKRLVQAASTGGMKGIVTKNRFCEIEFLAPPSDLQERFGYRCKQICEQTEARLNQAGRLDRLFSSLLHRAFTGDLTASWREAHRKELLQEMER